MSTHAFYNMRSKASFESETKGTGKESAGGSGGRQGKMMSFNSKENLFICFLVILQCSSNIGVILLNKYLLSSYGFKFPIFLTMCHMSACAILSYVCIVFFKVVPQQMIKSRSQFIKIATLSIVFCGSVVGGNISLRYLPVSFNQAMGATTPFFTPVFAYLAALKQEAWVTYGALVPVLAGVVIASGGELGFHLFGFIMCLSATAAKAFKSVLQSILLSSEGEKLNSMNLLLYMSPIAVLVLLPAALIMEPNVVYVTISLGRDNKSMWLLLLLNLVTAYAQNLTNFLVTKHTSALTFHVRHFLQQPTRYFSHFLSFCCKTTNQGKHHLSLNYSTSETFPFFLPSLSHVPFLAKQAPNVTTPLIFLFYYFYLCLQKDNGLSLERKLMLIVNIFIRTMPKVPIEKSRKTSQLLLSSANKRIN